MSVRPDAPRIAVNGRNKDHFCSFCCRPDGRPVANATHSLEKPYLVNKIPFVFVFSMCELCKYAREFFPFWDSMIQAARIKQTMDRIREELA